MSPTEAKVAAVFAVILKSDRLCADDDIFALGGDSMQAVSIALRLEDDFGVELPLEMLEESASVRTIAATIDRELARRDAAQGGSP